MANRRLEMLEAFANTHPYEFYGFSKDWESKHPAPPEIITLPLQEVTAQMPEPQVPILDELTNTLIEKPKRRAKSALKVAEE